MKKKTTVSGIRAVNVAVTLAMFIYTILAFLSIYMFGSSLKPDVLDNINDEKQAWESYVLRSAFLVVLACHIPFVFFSGKESFLILIDEADRKSVSKALES